MAKSELLWGWEDGGGEASRLSVDLKGPWVLKNRGCSA